MTLKVGRKKKNMGTQSTLTWSGVVEQIDFVTMSRIYESGKHVNSVQGKPNTQ